MRSVTLKRRDEDTCVEDEAEPRRQSVSSFSLGWGRACWATQIFLPLCTCPQTTVRAPRAVVGWGRGGGVGRLQINCRETVNLQIWTLRIPRTSGRSLSWWPPPCSPLPEPGQPRASPRGSSQGLRARLLLVFLLLLLPRASPLTWQLPVGRGGTFGNTNLTLARLKPSGGSLSQSAEPAVQRDGPLAGLRPLPYCPSQRLAHSDPLIVFPLRSRPL